EIDLQGDHVRALGHAAPAHRIDRRDGLGLGNRRHDGRDRRARGRGARGTASFTQWLSSLLVGSRTRTVERQLRSSYHAWASPTGISPDDAPGRERRSAPTYRRRDRIVTVLWSVSHTPKSTITACSS